MFFKSILFSLAIFFARGEAKILEFELTDKVSTVSTISVFLIFLVILERDH
jgi:hypothetical protein